MSKSPTYLCMQSGSLIDIFTVQYFILLAGILLAAENKLTQLIVDICSTVIKIKITILK